MYVIRWHPSQCSVDPIEEIILDEIILDNVRNEHFIKKVLL